MLHKTTNRIAGLLIVVALFAFVGCSSDEENLDTSVVDQVVSDIADSIADAIVDAEFAAANEETKIELIAEENVEVDNFNDMIVVDSIVYAVFDGGLLVYDLTDDTFKSIGAGEDLNAIALHKGEIYVGGKTLFRLADATLGKVKFGDENSFKPINPGLESVVLHYESGITGLQSFDDALLIGTGQGLFERSDDGMKTLREDVIVTAMTADENGLWIGTDGDGLFRYQDDKFHKRFLIRDSSIFNNVNCLDYNRGYVYAGTDDAFYIFDGGQWETLTTVNGLPSNKVRTINADGWVIYVGTDKGIISYFNGDFMPVKKMEQTVANVFGRWDSKMIVGTDVALMLKSRAGVKTLVESDFIVAREPAFVEEVLDTAAPDLDEIIGPLPAIVEIAEEPEDFDPIDSTIDANEYINNILSSTEPSEPTGNSKETVIDEIAVEGIEESVVDESANADESVTEGGDDQLDTTTETEP